MDVAGVLEEIEQDEEELHQSPEEDSTEVSEGMEEDDKESSNVCHN